MSKIDIVIVDDSLDILQILKLILTGEGYRIRVYQEAEALLKDVPREYLPDLFLLDISLPGMDGFSLCRELKSHSSLQQVPIIFISGLMDERDKIEGFRAGGEDYITKPFTRSDLLARVKTHLKLRRSLQELQDLNLDLESRIEDRTKELRRAKEDAEQANRAKTEFLSNINHEMRNPLNGIMGMLNLLKGTALDEEGKLYLSLAEYSANHLSAIIRDILDYSRMESSLPSLEYRSFDFRTMVEKLILIHATKAEEKGLSLNAVHPERGNTVFIADESRLYQILSNLVSNAIKFSKSGTITIRYEISGDLIAEVEDQGIGIPAEKADDIFLPFLQLDGGFTKENKGIGLGLAIVKNLVRAMKGSICLRSGVGGSCFILRIPDTTG